MDFTYRRVGAKDFDTTVEAVERIVRSHGFVLSRSHDITATLAAKGFQIHPLRVFEVVVGSEADTSGNAERDLVNVCRLHVFVEDGVVQVTAIRPTVMSRVFHDPVAQEAASSLEESVVHLVDEVVSI
jgi:uncharacterized protein (DUF302 family)